MCKLKIILCTVAIFIISAVGCFADSVDNINTKAMGLDDNPYYIYYNSTVNDKKYLCTFSGYESPGIITGANSYKYDNGSYVLLSSGEAFSFAGFTMKNANTNHQSLWEYIKDSNLNQGSNGEVIPPVIAPTVEKALTQIVPQFLEQLKNYLPACILILSMLLGVSLVPRIIHSLM